mgnify:CR=1 FL=1
MTTPPVVVPVFVTTSRALRAPSGTAWRFNCAGGRLEIADSVYFGGAGEGAAATRRTEQLVVSGPVVDGQPVKWAFRMLPRS